MPLILIGFNFGAFSVTALCNCLCNCALQICECMKAIAKLSATIKAKDRLRQATPHSPVLQKDLGRKCRRAIERLSEMQEFPNLRRVDVRGLRSGSNGRRWSAHN
jgi:ribosomal protein S13